MHVLMISLDAATLTQQIGNSRLRHQHYADHIGRVSMVICNRKKAARLDSYEGANLIARPTNSSTYFQYLLDGYRKGIQLATEHQVDLITSQDPFLTAVIGLALRRKLKVPLLIQDHSSFLESPHFRAELPRNHLLRWLALWTLPRADAVRVVNRQEREGCIRHGVRADRVCVIPVVPDIANFSATDLAPEIAHWKKKLDLTPDNPVVLWVGRPVTFKNLPMLIQAFAQIHAKIPAARLVLAGDMSGTTIQAQVEQSGLASVVRFPGAVAHSALPALYQTASVYAMSSNYEGLPVALLEASAAGLPVVTTANNGALDLVIDGQTGILSPIGDNTALANAIIEILNDPDRARELGLRAREHVKQEFNETQLMDLWLAMWRNVAARRPPCAS
jgi:glycosyltransferase involved in cell wall biosynthesis